VNRKTKIIVSVVGITIVLLALLGITYAYYLTRIEGNTNTNSISVTTADLKLAYGDGNGAITANDIMPGTTITKTFTVTNDGDSKVSGYLVILENINNDLERTEDLVYTLTCKLNDATSCGSTDEVEYPHGRSKATLYTNDIDPDVTHNYTLVVTYKNHTDIDQSVDMGSTFTGKVNIVDMKSINPFDTGNEETNELSLAYNIVENARNKTDGTELGLPKTTVAAQASASDEKVLSVAPDRYGASYYFRGSVEDNYVVFGDMGWRVVRINGDGSIKLVYVGKMIGDEWTLDSNDLFPLNALSNSVDDEYDTNKVTFGFKQEDNKSYADYEAASNGIKSVLTNWYTENLNSYDARIKLEKWCLGYNDTDKYDRSTNALITDLSGYSSWNYSSGRRVSLNTPNLKCENENYVKSKIGNLTVDEVLLAGNTNSNNEMLSYYLNDDIKDEDCEYFTMSIGYFDGLYNYDNPYIVSATTIFANGDSYSAFVRPVITINPGAMLSESYTNVGTESSPYMVTYTTN